MVAPPIRSALWDLNIEARASISRLGIRSTTGLLMMAIGTSVHGWVNMPPNQGMQGTATAAPDARTRWAAVQQRWRSLCQIGLQIRANKGPEATALFMSE